MQLAFYRGTSLLSRFIRWKSRGKYSHAAILFSNGECLEAWHATNSVRWITNLGDGHTNGTQVDIFDLPESLNEAAAKDFAQQQIGKKYGLKEVLMFLTNTSGDNPNNWFCSEIALAIARAGGINLLARVDAYKVSPSMLSWSPYLVFNETLKTKQ